MLPFFLRGFVVAGLILFCLGCNSQETVDLLSHLNAAEKKPDTEVILFGTSKASSLLTSWSESKRQKGGAIRWTTSDRARISWKLSLPDPGFLHLHLQSADSFPLEVYASDKMISRVAIAQDTTEQVLPLPPKTSEVELRLPPGRVLGGRSAVITTSPSVAEFRKPEAFPLLENIRTKGKLRKAMFYETGGAVGFFEKISPESVLNFGYYFAPSHPKANEFAIFSVHLTGTNGFRKKIFEKRVEKEMSQTKRIPMNSCIPASGVYKLEFRIARNVAFGNSKTAWIEPRIHTTRGLPETHDQTGALHQSLKDINVVLIVLDAASTKHFGCYGYYRATTPVVDNLAKQGVQFQRAYTNAVYTLASTATLFTGQLPNRHGILTHRHKLPEAVLTLPETMQQYGYETATFLANGNASGSFGLTQGFRTVREVFRDVDYTGRGEEITQSFAEWLAKHHQQKFFAYLHYREPHDPYKPPDEWIDRFVDPSYSGKIGRSFDRRTYDPNSPDLSEADRRHIQDLYDANLAYADSQVGEVLRALRNLRLEDQTMIAVTSDHGEAFWEHDFQGHNRQLYEESTRVPLVIKFPKNAGLANRKINFPVQTADFYPTLVDLLGISRQGLSLDGRSFLPYLMDASSHPQFVVTHSTRPSVTAIVQDRYKYIRNSKQSDELYNLKNDPLEKQNLIEKEPVQAGYLGKLLLMQLESKKPRSIESPNLDEATLENLKALGYVD